MMEPDRVLRPLREAEPAIEELETYESPAALTEALRATWHAVNRSLRLMLRSDPAITESLRMAALSEQETPLQTVINELRRRDRISIQLAGRVHELKQVVERTEVQPARPADADVAQDVVRWLRSEVHALADAPVRAAAHAAVEQEALGDEVHAVAGPRRRPRRVALLAGAAGLGLVALLAALFIFGRQNDMEAGIEAFRQERWGVAEQRFRSALARNSDDVTARLYLARILRQQGRHQEAAELLRAAATTAPRDPAVRRELGMLFLDLDRPQQAAEQFRIAVEQEPDEQLNWVRLIEALYRARDPSAEEWLRRAPPGAQAMIRTGRQ